MTVAEFYRENLSYWCRVAGPVFPLLRDKIRDVLSDPHATEADYVDLCGEVNRLGNPTMEKAIVGRNEETVPLFERVLAVLTPQQSRLMEFLWNKMTARYDALRTVPAAWNDEPSDEAITKKLKELRTRLEASNLFEVELSVSAAKCRVNIKRPAD
ncbi:MAG TPA: hypothetical protein VK137_13185 [Planctomycetaceae bacterium]|nr:hypothetical protein [Planctomycetaceae bacterium]